VHSATEANGPADVMIRPHRITISTGSAAASGGQNTLSGIVRRMTYAGNLLQYDVLAGDLTFQVEEATLGSGRALAPGTTVTLSWSAQDTLVFEAKP